VASDVKPREQPIAPEFAGKVPAGGWNYWRGKDREFPWNHPYINPYLFYWGAVFKFGPEGGAFYGQNARACKDPKYGTPRPVDDAANAPAGAETLASGYLEHTVKVAGHKWRFQYVSPVPHSALHWGDPGCCCYNSQMAVDPYGRVYAPNALRFCVEMIDTAGNRIGRIGRYGNPDDARSGIHFAWPAYVSSAGGKVFVADSVNHGVAVVKFEHAAEATAEIR
jgi:hypothetical protein